MPQSYSRNELLRLRESPLVCKPANLPSVEEWMGPIPDQSQGQNQNQRRTANRGRNEEASTNDGTPSRKPPFEGKARSGNAPGETILGPPKTIFASASGSRNSNKILDSPHRSSFSNHDESSVKFDRKSIKDRHDKDDPKDAEQSRDSRGGPHHNRRSVKDDNELWSSVRQPKSSGLDESDRPHRRNGDRVYDKDGQGGRDNRTPRSSENPCRDGGRENHMDNGTRRQGLGRGRNEPSWYRKETRTEEKELEKQQNTKPRDMQDKERGGARWPDRDWTRGAKADSDPEWMEAPVSDHADQSHTQEDFERWKERMKSGSASKSNPKVEQRGSHDRTSSGAGTSNAKTKVDTPLVVDSSVDGFFGLWNQPRNISDDEDHANGIQANPTKSGSKIAKASKFTGFFNPKPDTALPKEKPVPPLSAPTANSPSEDKEAFQRVLNMLGQQQQPQNGVPDAPLRAYQQRDTMASPPTSASRGTESSDLYGLLTAKSPTANHALQGRDSEFLMKLLQQPQQQRPDWSQGGHRSAHDTVPGLLPLSNLMISPHDIPQQTPTTQPPPGFFDESATRDKLNPGAERRAGPPPGFMDGNVPRQVPVGVPQQLGFPSGLQRPPGLDQGSGFGPVAQPQRPNMIPPPGFQAHARSQNNLPPGLGLSDRSQFGMPTTGRGAGPSGFMHPAPPGLPLPFSQEGLPYGSFSDAGNFGHAFPPGQQRR
ncbi:hypothetical protein ACLMJK_003364 [Lecanora helva]